MGSPRINSVVNGKARCRCFRSWFGPADPHCSPCRNQRCRLAAPFLGEGRAVVRAILPGPTIQRGFLLYALRQSDEVFADGREARARSETAGSAWRTKYARRRLPTIRRSTFLNAFASMDKTEACDWTRTIEC